MTHETCGILIPGKRPKAILRVVFLKEVCVCMVFLMVNQF